MLSIAWPDDPQARRAFLEKPNMLLEGARPCDMMAEGPDGVERVRQLVGRLAYVTAP